MPTEFTPETARPETAQQVVDWVEARDIVNGKEDLLRDLIEIFLSEGPRLLDQAQQSWQRGDAAGLRIAAHTLKGSARYFGARRLSSAARELEIAAGRVESEDAEALLVRVQSALEQLLPELRSYLSQHQ